MIDCRHGDGGIVTEILQSSDFRFGFESGHESTCNTRDQLPAVDEGNHIGLLNWNQRQRCDMNSILQCKPYERYLIGS